MINIDVDPAKVSDGYHTFEELYDHRSMLMIALMVAMKGRFHPYKTRHHNDGSSYPGMFMVGMKLPEGQISYHLEDRYWKYCEDIPERENGPLFDGHTSADVINRLGAWIQSE